AQFRAHSSSPVRGGILSRRDADHVFENAMEMIPAQSDRIGQRIQRGKRLRSFDDATRLCRSLRMSLLLRGAGRPAAFAGSKSGALGIGAGVVKGDVFAKRQPRWTCWSAINAGRGHGIDKLAVGRRVPPLHRKPALLIGGVCVPCRGAVLMSAVI